MLTFVGGIVNMLSPLLKAFSECTSIFFTEDIFQVGKLMSSDRPTGDSKLKMSSIRHVGIVPVVLQQQLAHAPQSHAC